MEQTDNQSMKKRITVRLADRQLKMLDDIRNKALPTHNRSEIVRVILDVIQSRLDNVIN